MSDHRHEEVEIPLEEEDLRALSDWADRDWYNFLSGQQRLRLRWRQAEWISYGWMLSTALVAMLGRRFEEDGRRTASILEIGFGVGRGIDNLVEDQKAREEMIVGVEVLPYRVEAAKAAFPKARFDLVGPRIGDLLEWFEKERAAGAAYELIVARHVLQRLPFPEKVLAGISGLLVEGGVFAMMVPPVGGTVADGPALITDLPIRATNPPRRIRKDHGPLMAATYRETDGIQLGRGWLPLLEAAKLHVEDAGKNANRSLPRAAEFYAFARRVR